MPASDVTVSATYAPDLATYWHADADHDGSTAEKAYIITTTGLDLLANQVNSGNTYENKYFKLGADITYSHTTAWDDATSTENNYTAIGGYYNDKNQTFSGHFDGQGHTVSDCLYLGNTLDGVRLDGQPVKSGIYINNGKKVSIK